MMYAALLGLLPAAAVYAHAQEAPAAPAAGQDDLAASDSSRSYAYGHEYGYQAAAPFYGAGYSHSYGHHVEDVGYGHHGLGPAAYGGVYGGVYAPYVAAPAYHGHAAGIRTFFFIWNRSVQSSLDN